MSLNYDIIYKIMFYVDDYNTLSNLFILDQEFVYNYIYRYKAPYKHKFRIIFNHVFSFLNMLQFSRVNSYDILFLIGTDNETDRWEIGDNYLYKRQTFRDHIVQIYTIYKKFLNKQFNYIQFGEITSTNQFAVNLVLMQGKNYIDRSIKIEFNRKKNKISGPSTCIKLHIDPEMKFTWPGNYNTFKLIEHNFQVLEDGLDGNGLNPQ